MSITRSALSTGKFELFLSLLILFGITIFFPMFFKTWFVEPTGNIKIAPFFGFIFGLGLLYKKNWARTGALILGWGVAAISFFSILEDSQRPGFWMTLVLAGFLLYLLHSERLKQYLLT